MLLMKQTKLEDFKELAIAVHIISYNRHKHKAMIDELKLRAIIEKGYTHQTKLSERV